MMWPRRHMLRACLRRKRRNLIKARRSFVAGDKTRSRCSCHRCQPPDLCFCDPFRVSGSYFTRPGVRIVMERHGDITAHPSFPIHSADNSVSWWRYLYHDVGVLAVLQQAEVGVDVELGLFGVGVGQDHLTLPQGLHQGLVPLCPLVRQQTPLKKGRRSWRSLVTAPARNNVPKAVRRQDFMQDCCICK